MQEEGEEAVVVVMRWGETAAVGDDGVVGEVACHISRRLRQSW